MSDEEPPLTPEQAREVLRRLSDLTDQIVLVGGQALAFWADRYADRFTVPGPVNSRDIDFGEIGDAIAIAAARLDDSTTIRAKPFENPNSPNSGVVEFRGPDGRRRRIDFLHQLFGLDLEEVMAMALTIDIGDSHGPLAFKVMHPVHCLIARISNVGGLPGYQSRLALDQARASILVMREYLRERIEHAVRPVWRLNERIYRFAWESPLAKKVYLKYGIDAFDAVLCEDERLGDFRPRRYPFMVSGLARRRAKW